MNLLTSDGPIIACSSGNNSNTAITLIRLSGFNDITDILSAFSLTKFIPRKAHFCNIIQDDKILDEVIAIFFKAPHSYTGENVLELNVHGNRLNVERIISFFVDKFNFSYANPGEFTYRALKKGKLNLSQVEGLDLLLNANSNFILEQGFSLMSGSLQKDYLALQKSYLKHRSAIELSIDFLDDVGEEASNNSLNDSLQEMVTVIKNLYMKINRSSHDLNKPDIVIFGDPNSGKSSVFNNLLSDERSIITDIKGTTRDFISEDYRINDVFFTLIDTAGIRETNDIVERKGVDRSIDKANTAFYKILAINLFDYDKENLLKYFKYNPDLIIFTHSDLYSQNDLIDFNNNFGPIEPARSGPIEPVKSGPIEPVKSGPIEPAKSGPIEPARSGSIEPAKSGPIEPALSYISINNNNFSDIDRSLLNELIVNKYNLLSLNSPISLDRHKAIIYELNNMVVEYSKLLKLESDISIVSSELSTIGNCISELIGIVSADDVLHNIFENFCIGK